MRPLTAEEKEFILKFEAETIGSNFYHTSELKEKKAALVAATMSRADTFKGVEKTRLEYFGLVLDGKTDKVSITAAKSVIRNLSEFKDGSPSEEKLGHIRNFLAKHFPSREMTSLSDKLSVQQYKDNLFQNHKTFYDEENCRNRCLLNKATISGKINQYNVEEWDRVAANSVADIDPENLMIHLEGADEDDDV